MEVWQKKNKAHGDKQYENLKLTQVELKWNELSDHWAIVQFSVVVINLPCVKCAAVCLLQIQRGSFPAPEGPSWSTWPWWCTVGLYHLRCSPRNFSPYILHCHSVQYSGPTGALLPLTCPCSLIRSGNKHGFVLHSLSAKQIWNIYPCRCLVHCSAQCVQILDSFSHL